MESLNQDPDVAAQNLRPRRYSDDFAKTVGSGRWWCGNTSAAGESQFFKAEATTETPPVVTVSENADYNAGFATRWAILITSGSDNGRGYFSAKIPLSGLLEFCRDVHKIMYGVKWSMFP